ncbi:MAG: response regulator [Anaerolineales bacterium]|nr:response regulator [Anaerolineales bacterium]
MTAPSILLVDDQKDIVRLLHSTLQTLGQRLDIVDAPSGEEALLEASRRSIDLLITDYLLPGMSGVELMQKVKARNADLKVIFISGMTKRNARDEMLDAGATAIFDKPIPLADFLDAVERSLGLVRTIFPPELTQEAEENHESLSDLLSGFRQKIEADAIFLISDRGRVLARAGDLYDSSMEVSMLSALMGIYNAGLKVSRFIRQEQLENYHIFRGGDHDLILIPVNSSHALLLAGKNIAASARILKTVEAMLFVRGEVERALQSLGVAALPAAPVEPTAETEETSLRVSPFIHEEESEPDVDVDALFTSAGKKTKVKDANAFWDEAAEKAGSIPLAPDMISFEEANKLGLAPDREGLTIPRPTSSELRLRASKKK